MNDNPGPEICPPVDVGDCWLCSRVGTPCQLAKQVDALVATNERQARELAGKDMEIAGLRLALERAGR